MTHPANITGELERLSALLEVQTKDHEAAAVEEAAADVAYKRAKARAVLQVSGPNEAIRGALAHQMVDSLYERWRVAAGVHDAVKEKGRNLRAQLDSLRSINANVRGQV